jgi:glycosyltransferase involved in cell wall biosynthesis
VADAVEFLGYVPDSELPRVYENADVFVMPSQTNQRSTEGFGLVFLEANYYGLPAVAWRSGGVSDSVVDNETGLLIPPGDIDGLTNALACLLEDPEFRFRLGRSGRDRVLREFDSRGVASEFAKVVESSMPLSAQEYRIGGGAR